MAARTSTTRTRALVAAKRGAAEYGLPYTTLRDVCLRGEIPIIRVGRAWYLERADIERWIDSHKERCA